MRHEYVRSDDRFSYLICKKHSPWSSGVGGTFLLRAGKVKFHVMPDFSSAALCSDSDVDAWLHYFEMSAPIVNVGTLVTGDLVSLLLSITKSALRYLSRNLLISRYLGIIEKYCAYVFYH